MTDNMPEIQTGYTVLAVEDDRNTLELITYHLKDRGYRVLTADNGADALAILKNDAVDLIVCDIMLPKMDGYALREELLKDSALKDVAFLYLTAKAMPEDEIRGLRTGVDEYITKPFNPLVLMARIDAVLARRETLARAAQLDPLTQLLNRQATAVQIRREVERIRRYHSVGSLVFLDVDEFKLVNDQFGHAAGDAALTRLADVLRQSSRTVDIVGRYGGEEFLIYYPETPEVQALQVLARVQVRFQEDSERECGRRLSFSAGVAEVPRDGEDFETLCGRADAAMYAAKHQGKGQSLAWRPAMRQSESGCAPS